MQLDLGRWRIRSYRRSDARALARHADNPNVAANLRDRFPSPYRLEDAEGWIDHVLAREFETAFAIADGTEAIGGIGVELQTDVYRRSGEIGFWLGEAFWGQGIMTRAVVAFSPFAFERYDLLRLYAGVFESNPSSARVLEKAGYRLEGRMRRAAVKSGRVLDVLLYARLANGTGGRR